jgi:asparagine synthetase B (glutamine-hydrolysing)
MLETYLPIPNAVWATNAFSLINAHHLPGTDDLTQTTGRFAAVRRSGDTIVMTRDTFGLNKLYFALDRRRLLAANYLADLVSAGACLDAIYAVPAGTATTVDLRRRTIHLRRYHHLPPAAGAEAVPHEQLAIARDQLTDSIRQVAAAYPSATVAVCLSGGLDSALIAALTRQHFADLTAYTYTFDDGTGQLSPDAIAAERLARRLGIRIRLVRADESKILNALPRALRFGQDWRDFNLHCAIVNELLAEAIASDIPPNDQPVLVVTGDLMNEFLGDYTPIRYRDHEYYSLPDIGPDLLRISLVRGLQCGDREVGVFAARGLTVLQPYANLGDHLLRVPSRMAKRDVINVLAGGLLPPQSYGRAKARAQIGGPTPRSGILPLLVDSGRHGKRLEHEFCDAIGLAHRSPLRGRIRAGTYRFPHQFPPEAP